MARKRNEATQTITDHLHFNKRKLVRKLIANSVVKELRYNNSSQLESTENMSFQIKVISFFDEISSFIVSSNCINVRDSGFG